MGGFEPPTSGSTSRDLNLSGSPSCNCLASKEVLGGSAPGRPPINLGQMGTVSPPHPKPLFYQHDSLCVVGHLNFSRGGDGSVGVAGGRIIGVQFAVGGTHDLKEREARSDHMSYRATLRGERWATGWPPLNPFPSFNRQHWPRPTKRKDWKCKAR